MSFNTPILIIFWRRSDLCEKLINALRPFQPTQLFLAGDGWENYKYDIREEVTQARIKTESAIDWDCKIRSRYSTHNQGCKNGVSNAINWFFENNSHGIILEEDCIPSPEFLNLCVELLNKYQHNTDIWTICGFNPISKYNISVDDSYFFSRFNSCWGWATWADRWRKYDSSLEHLDNAIKGRHLKNVLRREIDYNFWISTLKMLKEKNIPDTWDYQWTFTILLNNGLNIIPRTSLVKNEGFRIDATHTISKPSFVNNRQFKYKIDSDVITHPRSITASDYADYLIQSEVYTRYNLTDIKIIKQLLKKILQKLQHIIKV